MRPVVLLFLVGACGSEMRASELDGLENINGNERASFFPLVTGARWEYDGTFTGRAWTLTRTLEDGLRLRSRTQGSDSENTFWLERRGTQIVQTRKQYGHPDFPTNIEYRPPFVWIDDNPVALWTTDARDFETRTTNAD